MSREQGRGVPLDPRSDIYAVGIVAYEMLMGKPPFDAKIPTEVVMMHLRDRPPPLSGVPQQVANVVMRALEKDPGKRQQSADMLNQDCENCFAELFPRQTPGSGMHNVISPSAGVPAASAPPPAAAPPPAMVRAAASAPAEQKTQMAGMSAPSFGGVPPVAAEQKTQMAGMSGPNVGRAPAVEQKTQMPGGSGMAGLGPPPMAAPNAPPPPAPPPPGGGGPVGAPPIADQKTMMAGMPAPNLPPMAAHSYGSPQGTSRSNQRTMAVMAQSQQPMAQGTQILPDSAGVGAYAQEQARRARAMAQPGDIPAKPAGFF